MLRVFVCCLIQSYQQYSFPVPSIETGEVFVGTIIKDILTITVGGEVAKMGGRWGRLGVRLGWGEDRELYLNNDKIRGKNHNIARYILVSERLTCLVP